MNGYKLPPLEGIELEAAIHEAASRLAGCRVETHRVEDIGPTLRMVRGVQRARLIRLARKGKFRWGMLDYYPGIPREITDRTRAAARRGYAALLVITATRNGVHSTNSLHKTMPGRAVDLGNVIKHVGPTVEGRRRLVGHQGAEFRAWARGERTHMVELIGPDNNMVVLRGRHCPLPEGSPLENMHDNHVHKGFDS